jgi:hypothetical protein
LTFLAASFRQSRDLIQSVLLGLSQLYEQLRISVKSITGIGRKRSASSGEGDHAFRSLAITA